MADDKKKPFDKPREPRPKGAQKWVTKRGPYKTKDKTDGK